jgi:hypothetical protein
VLNGACTFSFAFSFKRLNAHIDHLSSYMTTRERVSRSNPFIFSIFNCVLATPAVAREIHEVRVDAVMDVAEGVSVALDKRLSDDERVFGGIRFSGPHNPHSAQNQLNPFHLRTTTRMFQQGKIREYAILGFLPGLVGL